MAHIPVVDLATATLSERRSLLREACQRVGCFRVVNHGIPPELLAGMKAAVRSLMDLPDEAKRRNSDVIAGSKYFGPTKENPLYEGLGIYNAANPADIDAFCACFDTSPQIRETIRLYAVKVHELAVDIAREIAESFGLADYSFEDWPCQFMLNKYNFTEETVGSSGVQIHTDSGFLTVLQDDDSVGGLEVMDCTGTFVPVNPVRGSFLVNLGDVAKAWSNGRLHNMKHRVLCKEASIRVSIALFMLAPKDDIVEAPAAFVDPDHPRLYRTFTYKDYRKLRLSSGARDGGALSLLAA